MTDAEKEYVEYWKKHRSEWNWGKTFKSGALYYGVPVVLLIDFINYFIIGGSKHAYISFSHFWRLSLNLILIAGLTGFVYGVLSWNMKERKYWKIVRKDRFGD